MFNKLFILFFLIFQTFCYGLEPGEILVIANRNAAKSVGLAKYYMDKRNIPDSNLLHLWVTDKEECSRGDYHDKIVPMVRKYLREKDPGKKIRCLVTLYGVPLKIKPSEMNGKEKKEHEDLVGRSQALKHRFKAAKDDPAESKKALEGELENLQKQLAALSREDQESALDSELALVKKEGYPLEGWIPNPHFIDFKLEKLPVSSDEVLMVSRLDGPTPEMVRRMIDDSLETETKGLSGTAYFDARWPKPEPGKKVDGYAFYDRALHLAADYLRGKNGMNVVLDDGQALFAPGQCPNAALYCGWYSLGKYVDAFQWQKGAVAYHIASAECSTLRNPGSQVWCKRMLEEGVAACVGPTSEPYVQAFPVPDIFFGLLADGHLSLVECYFAATPYLSWRMVLIGDPLYNPFHSRSSLLFHINQKHRLPTANQKVAKTHGGNA
ncbi:MAG: TIGR03790 family protein [Desulfobacteraceae bacterium]|nr:TIGR03790 family protein [Desulfobacteraceae bacterium]